jgi:electron transport complex protein RnfC
VVPPHHKKATEGRAVEEAPVPERLVVPVSQHLGAPCEPSVGKRDRVERGQVIADVDAMISAPIHSPVAGEVTGVSQTLLAHGARSTAIEIAPDPEQDLGSWARVEGDDVPALVRAAGVVGMGGAMFPSSVKLVPPKEFDIDSVILNGCECEPYLTCDHRLMLEQPERVVAGARIIAETVGASRTVIGIEDNKPDAIDAVRSAATDGVEVLALRTKYPQGAEKQLIWAVLGKEVPKGQLPAATGALVHNVGTAAAIADAVERGKPLVERVVTVTGAVKRPGNYHVLVGTLVSDLIEHAGGFDGDVEKVIAGGPMTGFALGSLDVPVVKGTSGIVAMRPGESTPEVHGDQPCIRCGRCSEGCPAFLQPFAIGNYANLAKWDETHELHVLDCIECGVCSFVCPTRRPLLQLIRLAKSDLMAKGVRP